MVNPSVQAHPAFELLQQQQIPSLNLEVQAFSHSKTGALHYHLAADNPENVFMVALRTIPTDSTGVAHILEHTALCGSEKYPVRDPFFMMLRRSLNTFMNAFTSSDWTAYPFASQNRKDYFNLLDVYLDAVFFSRLDPLDFAQEGHRVEFAEPGNPESDLVFKGVVFNEMKGAMSSPISVLWQMLSKHLYPTTTYHFNSGGEPENIPDLSYEQLVQFYRTHYHPSNAVFMTYGDLPAHELQQRIEDGALARFDRLNKQLQVPNEQRYKAPVAVEEVYASDEEEPANTHLVLGWLLGESTDLKAQLEAHLLANVLLNDSAAPLRHALETTDLGSAPSPLCGLEDSHREMCFACGLEGADPEQIAAIEALIDGVLRRVAEQGVSQDRVEAVLHQLELSQREVRGDSMPYGLQLMLAGLPAAIHRGDPIGILNLDPVLDELRERIQDAQYIPSLVQKLLLDNPHRVRLTLSPDKQLAVRQQQAEVARLAKIKAGLSAQQAKEIIALAGALEKRQQEEVNADLLPKVGIEDVPPDMSIPLPEKQQQIAQQPLTYYAQGTNGLVYQQLVYGLPHLTDELIPSLPFYASCLTELGAGDKDYLQMQAWQTGVSGGLSASYQMRGGLNNEQETKGYFLFSGKALRRNHEALTELMQHTANQVRFDEHERIKELVAQKRAHAEQSVTGRGNALAMSAACSGMSPIAALQHRLSGLEGIRALKELDDRLKDKKTTDEAISTLSQSMLALHQTIQSSERQFLLIAEAQEQESLVAELGAYWQQSERSNAYSALSLASVRAPVRQIWTTNTQVGFCAKAYPTVPTEHPDAVPLTVLGEYLKNGYLHRAIREQGGAYGASANQDSAIAAFRFSSYRDPRLQETLDDMDRALDWIKSAKQPQRLLEEAILGIIGAIDKPGSPAGEAKQAFYNGLFGRTPEQRSGFRRRVLQVTREDLVRVASQYLLPEKASIAVVTAADRVTKLSDSASYEVIRL